jgi:phosphoribosylaminoimidazole-succinocarboxamide synthase
VINLHPALPGQFPGLNAIERAFQAKVEQTGVMCHTVIEEVDAGTVLYSMPVPVLPNDTLETLTARVKLLEKTVLIMGLLKVVKELNVEPPPSGSVHIIKSLIRKGKVRDVYALTFEGSSEPQALMMVATDRFSCFDRNVCEIPQKGNVLNRLSAWWFKQTKHIVHNHLYHSDNDLPISFVRPCRVFPVEFVVRGFITGSTNTSMWTLYQSGVRSFGPIDATLSDDLPPLKKNQRLPRFFVTPTTKSDTHDEPITTLFQLHDLMTVEQFKECHSIALKLFDFGQKVALSRGLILVDTK